MKQSILKIHPKDNVIVALRRLAKNEQFVVDGNCIELKEDIPAKHKFFVNDLYAGDEIIMYGLLVGKAQINIEKGSLMSTINVKHAAQDYAYRDAHYEWHAPDVSNFLNKTFNGYHRSNGSVGTANYWIFIPTVFCENRNLEVIRDVMNNELGYATNDKYRRFTKELINAHNDAKTFDEISFSELHAINTTQRLFKNVDGIKFLNHTGGCGGTRNDAATLGKLLAAYACHPNVGGVTLLSLGCQHLQTQFLLDDIKQRDTNFNKPMFVFEQQASQSEEQLIAVAIQKTFAGLIEINKMQREPAPLNKLCIGVKCGGSDGFSGISANPAVGYCADLLTALGGKVLLAEFPELCGVEQNIVDRSINKNIAEKFTMLMKTYDAKAHQVGSGFYMNPSPGNIKDGLITDAIKSAGAAKKGGTSPVQDVLDYTETATKPGLSLVCTPGNDVEATTGLAGSGATLILFTTGLGTPTGNPVCPTIKIATNTGLAMRMKDIIDIDTGAVITGDKNIEQMGEEILNYCIKAASGEVVPKAVLLNQDDFIPWKRDISL